MDEPKIYVLKWTLHEGSPEEAGFVEWSQPDDPNDFRPRSRSIWCPRWLQPLVFWVLRRLKWVPWWLLALGGMAAAGVFLSHPPLWICGLVGWLAGYLGITLDMHRWDNRKG